MSKIPIKSGRFLLPPLLLSVVTTLSATASVASEPTRMLRQPALSRDHLAFVYAGDLWLADRNGQNVRRLTAHPAEEVGPIFTPDGKSVVFTGRYDGNTDVYIIPIDGGQPRRLTWHPAPDTALGFSADGKRVLFASPREIANGRSNQLYEVPLEGGGETKVMEAHAFEGQWSADGKRLAYRPYRAAYSASAGWRLHRGGSSPPIWIVDLKANTWERVPHVNASDIQPFWIGDDVAFISDRDGVAANLFRYDAKDKTVKSLTRETTWDVRSASAYSGVIVYEAGGLIKELTLTTGATRTLDIRLSAQSPQTRPQWKDAAGATTSARLSATGKRVLVTARGDVYTVPVKDGSVRNLTASAGSREKDALWSPDGQTVAYLSDGGARQHSLHIRDQQGLKAPRIVKLGLKETEREYFQLLAWSPDGKSIAYADQMLNLYLLNVADGVSRKIDNRGRRGPFNVAFSGDSRWLAYVVAGENLYGRIQLHELATGKSTTVTDGLAHADNPVFGGHQYLYFTASINNGPSLVGLDMSSQERPVRDGIYALVLAADAPSPMAPRTADEDDKRKKPENSGATADVGTKPAAAPGAKGAPTAEVARGDGPASKPAAPAAKPPQPVKVDFAGLQQRVVALPVAERNYSDLAVASDGALFYLDNRQPGVSVEPPDAETSGQADLVRFNFEERKPKTLKSGVQSFDLSADGKKVLLRYNRGKLEIGDANDKLDAKPIDTSGLGAVVDPRAEWQQIFDESWWMQRAFFYDPALHKIDWDAIYQRYRPLLAHVQRREDLNELLREMIGELQVGHNNVSGGDVHRERPAAVGLLGADLTTENGATRIKRILRGDRWNPFLRAPLAVPGLKVDEGDYILAVNGRPLAGANVFSQLESTVGKQVSLTVAATADGMKAREIVVVPIANEAPLRQWAWVERNREAVDKATGGRVAYVYLPDTAGDGYKHFNRMFFAQIDKDGVIVDDRRNSGGQAANYVVDVLARQHLAGWKDRAGYTFETPAGGIYGAKAMLMDQDAGSGGDFLPYAFKRMGLGPLIGKRTWGGLIGIAANPPLIDGGSLTVPFFRFFTPEKEWRIENEGVAPDMDVELDPLAVNRGVDTQLDAAIASVMQRLGPKRRSERVAPPPPFVLGR
jgi:tricorn protease